MILSWMWNKEQQKDTFLIFWVLTLVSDLLNFWVLTLVSDLLTNNNQSKQTQKLKIGNVVLIKNRGWTHVIRKWKKKGFGWKLTWHKNQSETNVKTKSLGDLKLMSKLKSLEDLKLMSKLKRLGKYPFVVLYFTFSLRSWKININHT
jgi:hypothetical protein